jgi:hypothetical protein
MGCNLPPPELTSAQRNMCANYLKFSRKNSTPLQNYYYYYFVCATAESKCIVLCSGLMGLDSPLKNVF